MTLHLVNGTLYCFYNACKELFCIQFMEYSVNVYQYFIPYKRLEIMEPAFDNKIKRSLTSDGIFSAIPAPFPAKEHFAYVFLNRQNT
uniref:Uncharacterized protein n=1 Tax=Panagrellus redivivus TaxID=6233 RepID=A0A7E4UUS6_PANRE